MTRTCPSEPSTSKTAAATYCQVRRSNAFKSKGTKRLQDIPTLVTESTVYLPGSLKPLPPGGSTTASRPERRRRRACYTIPDSPRLAMDCEMVGVGPNDHSALARCSIVDECGRIVYDSYVKPHMWVKNYRTRWSGITKKHLQFAVPFEQAVRTIESILHGCIVVGHDLRNDFGCLGFSHPQELIRDTSDYQPFKQSLQVPSHNKTSLKKLTKALLNRNIQNSRSGHCSVEDARAAMELYQLSQTQWEEQLLNDRIFLRDHFWQDCN